MYHQTVSNERLEAQQLGESRVNEKLRHALSRGKRREFCCPAAVNCEWPSRAKRRLSSRGHSPGVCTMHIVDLCRVVCVLSSLCVESVDRGFLQRACGLFFFGNCRFIYLILASGSCVIHHTVRCACAVGGVDALSLSI